MERKKRSILWLTPKTEIEAVVKNSKTLTQVLNYYKMNSKGGNHKTLKARLEYDNIDYSHIPTGLNSNKGIARGGVTKISLKKVLVKNSTYNRYHLKNRLIKAGLLDYRCYCCGITSWLGQRLSLQIEHKNGISNDNRLLNLELLCPNCHSQTATFAGKKR